MKPKQHFIQKYQILPFFFQVHNYQSQSNHPSLSQKVFFLHISLACNREIKVVLQVFDVEVPVFFILNLISYLMSFLKKAISKFFQPHGLNLQEIHNKSFSNAWPYLIHQLGSSYLIGKQGKLLYQQKYSQINQLGSIDLENLQLESRHIYKTCFSG